MKTGVVVLLYGSASVLALLLYGWDKACAKRGAWRVRENTLHTVALFGGWPGALLAQSLFRHKSRKASFRAMFWCTVAANCAGLAVVLCA